MCVTVGVRLNRCLCKATVHQKIPAGVSGLKKRFGGF